MPDVRRLVEGYHRFREGAYLEQRSRFDHLAEEGQAPRAMIIACSDSRVDPAIIFDTNPGEAFVVRNVAALVPPYETTPGLHGVSAALEFGVQVIGVGAIVVLGHGRCGGCKVALSQELRGAAAGEGGFIQSWISLLDGARASVVARCGTTTGRAAERAMEEEGVKISLGNLRTFPYIAEKERAGQLRIAGAFFAIADGILSLLDEATGNFIPV
jgi:carbonic anhydrase